MQAQEPETARARVPAPLSRWTSLGCFKSASEDIEQTPGVELMNLDSSPLKVGGAVMVPTEPVNCTIACSELEHSIAAMRGQACFCLRNRTSFDAVNVVSCDLRCMPEYYGSTAKFCGGSGAHYSLYQIYDFIQPNAQGCYDPFRYIWYQSVAVETYVISKTTGRLTGGFQWYLHAVSLANGDPLFPYQHKLENMLLGLHYDLDASRILGYFVPDWNAKTPVESFTPIMQIWEMNTKYDWALRFWSRRFSLAVEHDMLATGVTAFDSIYDIYYLTVPGIVSDEGDHFLTRIYALNTDRNGQILHAEDVNHQVVLLEVNDDTHELFAVMNVVSDRFVPPGHYYVRLGEALMFIKWPDNPYEPIVTTLQFRLTFSGDFREDIVNSDLYFGPVNVSEKYMQIGATAIDVTTHSSFWLYKDRPDSGAPYMIQDVYFRRNKTNETDPPPVPDPLVFNPIRGPEVNAMWIFNKHPITGWFSPEVLYVRFHMDGHIVYVRFENETIGGIQPYDVNGDAMPDAVDWGEFVQGRRNCSEMFAPVTSERLRYMPYTQCEFQDNHTLLIRLRENVTTLNVGETIVLKNDTIYSYYPELQTWSFAAFGEYEVNLPDPLLPPAPQVFSLTGGSAGMDFSVYPKDEVPMCYTSGIDADNSYYHGGVPTYTWTLFSVICTYTDSYGFTSGFWPNQSMVDDVRAILENSTAGTSTERYGKSRVDFKIMDLEPGCTYAMRMDLLGRWGLSAETNFELIKQPPPPVEGWMPPCDYYCNAATCEPPSRCVNGVCVCAKDRWGIFCSGICPMCSPYKSFGCDDGSNGTGTCICRKGWVGDYCDQKVEWKATDWSPCLPCGGAVGSQSRVLRCENVVTQQIVPDDKCIGRPAASTQQCKPPLCPCGPPPAIEGADNDAIAKVCPTTLSGAACSVICLPGYIGVGEFTCYAGGFVEIPQCMPGGTSMVTLPGLTLRLRIGGIELADGAAASAYLAAIGPALKIAVAEFVSETSAFTVSPDYVTLTIEELPATAIVGGGGQVPGPARRLGVANVTVSVRRLKGTKSYEIVVTIAFPNLEALEQGEASLKPLESDPSSLRDKFKAQYLATCNQTEAGCVALPPDSFWEADAPTRTQVYSVQKEAVVASTTIPIKNETEVYMGSPTAKESQSDSFVLGIIMGISIGVVTMICCGMGIFGFWFYTQRKNAEVAPEPEMPDVMEDLPPRVSSMEPAENTRITNQAGKKITGRINREWAGGGNYEGYVWEGLREGEGRMEWPNGKIYAGQWLRGKPHGHGLLTAPGERGWVYNGQFKNGLREGSGRCESITRGIWYEGEWQAGIQHGIGENGALPHAPGDLPTNTPLASPPIAHLWTMENGEQHEHLAISPFVPDASNMIRFSLETNEEDLFRIHGDDYKAGGQLGPSLSEVQEIAVLWGIAFGVPDIWLAGRCKALIITRIIDDGALARWNMWQHRDFGREAEIILPNALIWRVNDAEGDVEQMRSELTAAGARRSISFTVSNPASSRCPRKGVQPAQKGRLDTTAARGRRDSISARAFLGRAAMQPPRPPEGVLALSAPDQPEVMDLRSAASAQMSSAVGLLNLPPAPPPLPPPRPPNGRAAAPARLEENLNLPPLPKATSTFSYRRAGNPALNAAFSIGREDRKSVV